MPTYQYACTECGDQLEAVQSFSDPALTECPNCSGKLRKVFNSVGIVFKGSGFYRNDSRSGNGTAEKPAAATETKSDSATPATTSTPAAAGSSTSSSNGSSGSSKSSGSNGSAGSSPAKTATSAS